MSEKKQVARNLAVYILASGSKMLIGLWLAPYLIKHLGHAAYGFIPIAAILTEYIGIITNAIDAAIARYLLINIEREKWDDANRVFNTSFFSNTSLAFLQIPFLALIVFNLSNIFVIPKELLEDVIDLCIFSMAGYSLSIISSVFGTSMFAKNRLDLSRMTEFIAVIVRIALVVILFTVDRPLLLYVGLAKFSAAVVRTTISIYYWRKLTPKLHIKFSYFDRSRLKAIMSMSGWLIVNYVGVLLFLKLDLFIVNKFVGVGEAGKYAAIMQWSNVIRTFAIMLSMVTTPLVLAAYAKKEYERLTFITLFSMKFLGSGAAIIVGIIVVQSEALLNIWIGPEVSDVFPVMVLLLVHLPIGMSVLVLGTIFTAYNKVRLPGILTLFSGVVNLGLAIFLAKRFGIYGVAIAGLLVQTLMSTLFTSIYAAKVMQRRFTLYLFPVLKSIVATGMVILLALPVHFFEIDSWPKLILSSAIVGVASLPVLLFTVLNREERAFLVSLIPDRIRAKFARKQVL